MSVKNSIGIIGYPLGHTLSPVLQQAALDALGIEAVYRVWETPPDRLARRVGSLRGEGVLGANVTVPYKKAVLEHLNALDSSAQELEAVNTIIHLAGRLIGYNTDLPGFLDALRIDATFDSRGKKAVVIGAGGSARAVAVGLGQAGAASLTLLNRTLARGQAFADELAGRGWRAQALPLEEGALAALEPPDVLVNCTPYGMKGSPLEGLAPPVDTLLAPSTLVVDLVYNPSETPLLRQAAAAGARVLGGLPMLVYQGAASFRIWTGREAPVEVMLKAARKALGEEVRSV